MAGVAAYASYVHQREFAVKGGADSVSASLWPLSMDGLLLLATVGVLKPSGSHTRRARGAVWFAFLGIAVSLAPTIAAAPVLAWRPSRVAAGRAAAVGSAVGSPIVRTEAESADAEDAQAKGGNDLESGDSLLERPGEWMHGIGKCISARCRRSRSAKSCGSAPTGRGGWWRWCARSAMAAFGLSGVAHASLGGPGLGEAAERCPSQTRGAAGSEP
ncbi:DUF2637 domain-containing protein [Streptomyces griseoruber]